MQSFTFIHIICISYVLCFFLYNEVAMLVTFLQFEEHEFASWVVFFFFFKSKCFYIILTFEEYFHLIKNSELTVFFKHKITFFLV